MTSFRHIIGALFLSMLSLPLSAQSIDTIFLSMPDTLCPYLDKSQRAELLDFARRHLKAEVKNNLKGTSTLDTIYGQRLSATLSKSRHIELAKLPTAQGDSMICLINTIGMKREESTVKLYTLQWKHMRTIDLNSLMPALPFPSDVSADSLSNAAAKHDLQTISAELSSDGKAIILKRHTPLLPSKTNGESIRVELTPLLHASACRSTKKYQVG